MSGVQYVGDRRLITATVLEVINGVQPTDDQVDASFKLMWRNQRVTGGMALTDIGNKIFEDAQLEFWEFSISEAHKILEHRLYIQLNCRIPAPYYTYGVKNNEKSLSFLHNKTFRVYDSRVAMMIGLHGDVQSYLATLPNITRMASRTVKWIK